VNKASSSANHAYRLITSALLRLRDDYVSKHVAASMRQKGDIRSNKTEQRTCITSVVHRCGRAYLSSIPRTVLLAHALCALALDTSAHPRHVRRNEGTSMAP
jgi:hypothetical protein